MRPYCVGLLGLIILTSHCVPCVSAQDDILKQIGERYEAQQTKFDAAYKNARSTEERGNVFRQLDPLDPRNTFVEEFLALEEKYRRQPVAISALYRLLRNAVSTSDPDFPVSQGRVKAIKILREHYLDHPDLDLLLDFLDHGAFVPQAEDLLREVTKSADERVRASGLYYLASFLRHKAELVDDLEEEPRAPDAYAQARIQEIRNKLREQIRAIGPIDIAREREEAVHLADQILRDHPQTFRSYAKEEGPGKLSVRRMSEGELTNAPTFGSLAESLRFELVNLQEGQVAPDIIGTDADGQEFKLSDYRGRVVLLMFSANWCAPCKAMYPDLRKLQAELAGEPYAMLAVMGDYAIDSVIHAVERADIRWRTWFDGGNGPIATQWNVTSWPTLYLFDHKGVIASRRPGSSLTDLKESIGPLLAAAKEDPKSQDLLAAHPIPNVPILDRAKVAAALRDRAKLSLEFTFDFEPDAVAVDDDERLVAVGGHRIAGVEGEQEATEAWEQGKATGVVELWDIEAGKKIRELAGSFGAVSALALSPDGRLLVTAGRALGHPHNGHLMLWDTESGQLVKSFGNQPRRVLAAAFSPDGSYLATGGFDKSPRIWSIPAGDEIKKLPEQPSYSDYLLFTPDGRRLIVPSRRGHVTVWDTQSWELKQEMKVANLFLLAADLSPDGSVLAVGGGFLADRTGRVTVWNLKSADVLAEFNVADLVGDVSFSPDGRLLAATGTMEDVTIWHWAEKKVVAYIPADRQISSSSVVFLPKSGRLIVNEKNRKLPIYELD